MIYGGDNFASLDDLQKAVDESVRVLQKHAKEFDFIAVRGCSGILVGSPVSLRLNKPLVVVRKPGENQHGWGNVVNASHATGRYVFLDDFVSSGATRLAVIEALLEYGCELVATVAYHDAMGEWRHREWREPDNFLLEDIEALRNKLDLSEEVAA